MLKEFAKFMLDAGAAIAPSWHPPSEPGHVYYLLHPDGRLERREAAPPPRDHQTLDLDSLVRFVRDFATGEQHAAVWYSRHGVVAVLDDSRRRDRVTFDPVLSPQIRLFMMVGEGPGLRLPGRDMADVFLYDLNGCGHDGLVAGYKLLDPPGEGPPPPTTNLEIRVPVFQAVLDYLTFPLECRFSSEPADPDRNRPAGWRLRPYPGAVKRAVREAERKLGEVIHAELKDETHVSVYYGSP